MAECRDMWNTCVCMNAHVVGSKRHGYVWHQGKRSPREDVEIKEMKGVGNWETNVWRKIGKDGVKNVEERLSFSLLLVASKSLKKIPGRKHTHSHTHTLLLIHSRVG